MNNIITLPRCSRPARLPQRVEQAPSVTVDRINSRAIYAQPSRQAREMQILEQFRIWFLASEESPGAKEAVMRQLHAFKE